jgi:sugar lactone lactonase YvrE
MFIAIRPVVVVTCIATALCLGVPASALALGPLSSFGTYGKEPGQMSTAGGIAIATDGLAYVADSDNNRIDVFAPDGSFVRSIGKVLAPSEECDEDDQHCQGKNGLNSAGALSAPKDVALDSTGNVFVADSRNNRISVFSTDGTFIRAFGMAVNSDQNSTTPDVCTTSTGCGKGSATGGIGALSSPAGIGIDSAGLVYVADTGNYRVDVFSSEGKYIRSVGNEVSESQKEPDFCRDFPALCPKEMEARKAGAMKLPSDVAVDAKGQVAVADPGNRRIDVFASDGTFVRAFGKNVTPNLLCLVNGDCNVCTAATGCTTGDESSVAGGLASPTSIVVGNSGSLYVADAKNHRINEFSFDGTFTRAFGAGVVDGASTFQVCTGVTDCKAGIPGTIPGAVSGPRGTAMDCRGAIYAVEAYAGERDELTIARVERFGEPETALPPCTPPSPPDETPPVTESLAPIVDLTSLPKAPHIVAKPKIKIELNQGSGTAVLVVIVSDPGALLLKGKGIRKVRRLVKRAGLIELLVETTGKTERKLKDAGKAKVKVLLTFKPDEGKSITQAATVALKLVAHL